MDECLRYSQNIDTFYDYMFDIINITKNKYKQSFVNYIDNKINEEVFTDPVNKQIKPIKKSKQMEI